MRGTASLAIDGSSRLKDIPLDADHEDGPSDETGTDHHSPGTDDSAPVADRQILLNSTERPLPLMDDEFDAFSQVSSIATATISSIRDSIAYTFEHWKILLFGQVLSFLLACNGAAQATLNFECSLSAPAFSMSLYYLTLSLFLLPLHRKGRRLKDPVYGITDAVLSITSAPSSGGHQQHQWTAPYWLLGRIPLYAPAWIYAGIAFLDVTANYLTVLAYRYTTLTSVTLFDALAIPSTMVFSTIFLKRRFTNIHLLGVATCMWGILYNVLADYTTESGDRNYPHRLSGDLLAMAGGLMFGITDVLSEQAVRHYGGPDELLGMMGFFASMMTMVLAAAFERAQIAQFFRRLETTTTNDDDSCSVGVGVLLTVAFVGLSTMSYIGIARFLLVSEATLLNLSLLTADAWAILFSVTAQGIVPTPLFWAALVMTVSGVLIYEMGPSTAGQDPECSHPKTEQHSEFSRQGERRSGNNRDHMMVEMSDLSTMEVSSNNIRSIS
jgi:solute carrier family 35 protein F1/2